MSKKQKEQTITINEKEYKESDFNPEQVTMINHEQLQFGRDAFMIQLTKSLEES